MIDKEIKDSWKVILYPHRFRGSDGLKKIKYKNKSYNRNPFDSDYLRIVMSAPFRRLQDKAQVFPLERSDFVRTRLTHSIEVSGIARSLGVSVENIFFDKKYITKTQFGHIPSLLSVAGLIHDIGNPPFGHFGEKTIQIFFKKYFDKNHSKLTEEQKKDFLNFDGNVQGLRILLKLSLAKDDKSLNLTFPTLATIIKYPKHYIENYENKDEDKSNSFAYFQSELKKYKKIDEVLNLNGKRHPLTFVLEAADDIAYSVSDIEDGCKKKSITIDLLKKTLKLEEFILDKNCQMVLAKIESVSSALNDDFPSKELLIAQECRTEIQRLMMADVIETFMNNHEKILRGEFNNELIEASNSKMLRKFTKKIAKYNFNDKNVVKSELVGENVISYLLENFISAVATDGHEKSKTKEGKMYSIISNHYKYVINNLEENEFSQNTDEYDSFEEYKKYLLVTDYISGMTDSFALTLYNELLGISV